MEKALFHTRLKSYRLKSSLSIYEFSRKIGVPASTYREWEYGRGIRGEPYLKIAEILGISVYELLSGEKPSASGCLEKLKDVENSLAILRAELMSLK